MKKVVLAPLTFLHLAMFIEILVHTCLAMIILLIILCVRDWSAQRPLRTRFPALAWRDSSLLLEWHPNVNELRTYEEVIPAVASAKLCDEFAGLSWDDACYLTKMQWTARRYDGGPAFTALDVQRHLLELRKANQ